MTNFNRIEDFIQEDLAKSGLSLESFPVTLLMSETELMDRLGFKFFGEKRITDVGGYWIPFPNVSGYYRLKLKEPIGDAKYLSPKNSGNHVYIPAGVERLLKDHTPGEVIGLVEGEKKAQAATDAGVPTIGLSGVWNFKDSDNDFLSDLEQHNWKEKIIKIAFDSDITRKPGVKHAELRAAVEFTNRGAEVYSVRLPDEPDGSKNGADDFIQRYGAVKYNELNQKARRTLELLISENMKTETFIKEISRLDSNIEKDRIAGLLASYIKVPAGTIRTELKKQIAPIENNPQVETYTEEEIHKAEQLLKGPDILSKMTETTARAGYVGEEINQKMLYLSYTSRLMHTGISNEIKGGSASGKSSLVHMIQRLMPQRDIHRYSMITSKALVHCDFDLSHKILSVEEHHGAEAADYSIRTVISEQEISILISVKDERTNNYKAVEKRIPAVGMVYTETTTAERVHNENQTRVFDLFMDESSEMNQRVIDEMAETAENPRDTEAIEKELREWRCAQTLLKPHKVRIPFAKKLSKEFPTEKTRVRRDFLRFLALIETHTLLYQFQREVDKKGYLVARLEDLKGILPLAEMVLTQSLKEISPKQEFVLTLIRSEFKSDEWFSLAELQEKIKTIATSATSAKPCQIDLAEVKVNNNGELDDRNATSATISYKYLFPREIPYRTLHRYIKGFEKDGLLQWNGEKSVASKYSYISNSGRMAELRIFTPNFLASLENSSVNTEWHDLAGVAEVKPNGKDKEAKADKEGSGFTKTIVVDGELIRLEYDDKAGTITVRKNGKTPYVCWDPEPGFQEYLRYFEGGV